MEYEGILTIALAIIVVLVLITKIRKSLRPIRPQRPTYKKQDWVDTADFQRWKEKIYSNCDEKTLMDFMNFLKLYKGGYIKRRNGRIVYQDFLGKEKGDLKGIFYNIVVPAKKIPVQQKELFRNYLQGIGVTGLEQRPSYELQSGKLKADSRDEEEYRRKLSGNRGEQQVRDCLKLLDDSRFSVMNGVVLRIGTRVKEFDHIIVGDTGVFVLETKAFGMSEKSDGFDKARLVIDTDGQWKLYKYHNMRVVKNPAEQILEEKHFIAELLIDTYVDVNAVLVLANKDLVVEKNGLLFYKVIMLKDLVRYITQNEGELSDSDKYQIISKIQEHRVN